MVQGSVRFSHRQRDGSKNDEQDHDSRATVEVETGAQMTVKVNSSGDVTFSFDRAPVASKAGISFLCCIDRLFFGERAFIPAIKAVKAATGSGLAESKKIVETGCDFAVSIESYNDLYVACRDSGFQVRVLRQM